jgi:hypothetical protein
VNPITTPLHAQLPPSLIPVAVRIASMYG